MPMTMAFLCINCGRMGTGHPERVLSVPARWDEGQRRWLPDTQGKRQPVCRACAELGLERIRRNDPTLTDVSPALRRPDFIEWAYESADDF